MKLSDLLTLYGEKKREQLVSHMEEELKELKELCDYRNLAGRLYDILKDEIPKVPVPVYDEVHKKWYEAYRQSVREVVGQALEGMPTQMYKEGDRVRVVKNLGKLSGGGDRRYYYGGRIIDTPLQSEGSVFRIMSESKIEVILECGRWYCYPDELVLLLPKVVEKKITTQGIEQYLVEKEQEAKQQLGLVMGESIDRELLIRSINSLEGMQFSRKEIVTFLGKYFEKIPSSEAENP